METRTYPHQHDGRPITLVWTAYGAVKALDALGRPLPPETAWRAAESFMDAHRDPVSEVLDRLGIEMEAV